MATNTRAAGPLRCAASTRCGPPPANPRSCRVSRGRRRPPARPTITASSKAGVIGDSTPGSAPCPGGLRHNALRHPLHEGLRRPGPGRAAQWSTRPDRARTAAARASGRHRLPVCPGLARQAPAAQRPGAGACGVQRAPNVGRRGPTPPVPCRPTTPGTASHAACSTPLGQHRRIQNAPLPVAQSRIAPRRPPPYGRPSRPIAQRPGLAITGVLGHRQQGVDRKARACPRPGPAPEPPNRPYAAR